MIRPKANGKTAGSTLSSRNSEYRLSLLKRQYHLVVLPLCFIPVLPGGPAGVSARLIQLNQAVAGKPGPAVCPHLLFCVFGGQFVNLRQ